MAPAHPLPVDSSIPELLDAMRQSSRAVLVAPPGAGKTTQVPSAIGAAAWCGGKVVVLEPRRLAARAAASYVAARLGEPVGGRIGYRVRLDSNVSRATRIEFVTEGVFTRQIGADPELSGVSAVIFDEFHERNLDGDLGLALALETQTALRSDLRLLVMSATLQGERIAQFLGDAPLVESEGRGFPVEIRHVARPNHESAAEAMARAIVATLADPSGSILCFLPGQGEIRQTRRLLDGRLPPDIRLHELYGSLDISKQDEAIRPAQPGTRKVVLATPIAETSLTIDGVNIVIDSGLRRVPRHDIGSGLTRLETVRAARSSIAQRAGRAGRTAPGLAIRLWPEAQTAALPAQERPEIMNAELSGLALTLADWGVTDPAAMRWLTPPPAVAWQSAVLQLRQLGALGPGGGLTPHGRRLRDMPLAPRLGHMVVRAARHSQARDAAILAMVLSERGLGGYSSDLSLRLDRLAGDRSRRAKAARDIARNIAGSLPAGDGPPLDIGGIVSLAYPERIARARGDNGRYLLANGSGARIDTGCGLARAAYLVAADLQGKAASPRIVSAAEIAESEIDMLHGPEIETARQLEFDESSGRFRALLRRKLGAVVLSQSITPICRGDEPEKALCDLIRRRGLSILNWSRKVTQLRARLAFLHSHDPDRWPGVDDPTLTATLEQWLLPFLDMPSGPADVRPEKIAEGLKYLLAARGARIEGVDLLAPSCFVTPAGSTLNIDYRGDAAVVGVRVQEMFGMSSHPAIIDGRVPLTLELLSPAMRPIQVTTDLPGFWTGSWRDVRRDMRGRYPKHPWPENPAKAAPTRRTRRTGGTQ